MSVRTVGTPAMREPDNDNMGRRRAVQMFLAFASAYFLSALIRTITATLSPTLTAEFNLNARDLGLLAGGYFLGFSLTQLPLGAWLDRYGPRRVLCSFLTIAVLGCLAFWQAQGFAGVLFARVLCGIGVSACLMAPLTAFRRWFEPNSQLRANSWMLMTGSLGMVASTLPVQWLMPMVGWRALFLLLATLLLLSMMLVAWKVPSPSPPPTMEAGPDPSNPGVRSVSAKGKSSLLKSYLPVWRHPYFRRMVPIGFFCYGGLLAMQTLWVVPWMTRVAKYSPQQAAQGFFWINVCMLFTFWLWGWLNPRLAAKGLHANRLIAWGQPLSFICLAILIAVGDRWTQHIEILLALYCMTCSFVSLSQPAVGMAFDKELAGRALSGFNLVLFVGIFVVQWGIGLLIDGFRGLGASEVDAFRGALAVFLGCCVASYAHFLWRGRDNSSD
jgi:predicted MFS family arabinose efflux permease